MSLDLDALREGDAVLVRAKVVAVHRLADPARSFVSVTLGDQDCIVTASCGALVTSPVVPCQWVFYPNFEMCRVCGADYAPGWDEARPVCKLGEGA